MILKPCNSKSLLLFFKTLECTLYSLFSFLHLESYLCIDKIFLEWSILGFTFQNNIQNVYSTLVDKIVNDNDYVSYAY